MAELVLSSVGRAIGSRLPGALSAIGSALGQAGGTLLGRAIDQRIFGGAARYEGARLTDLHLLGSTEGASIPAMFGRVRISGQVIWAARFKEQAETRSVSGGGKGGPRATARTYRYTLSFAIGLCEGVITRIGRAWANGEPMDLGGVAWRLHNGAEDQEVDPLIEAIEGADRAPAYRGLAYVVFEDLPLEAFGNTIPQLSFEVFRAAPTQSEDERLEDKVRHVCLIPSASEFVYATEPVFRKLGPGQEIAENVHVEQGRANLLVSLDQLRADLPNCDTITLVTSWFADDLRCGVSQVRPGVERAVKETAPISWRAGGVSRAEAHVVSEFEGAPAFGGTPSDRSIVQAITELKARGYKVRLYPFVLMDIPPGNAKADPYGASEQAAYPWRGRITVHPAAGMFSSPDKTAAASGQIAAFFGTAAPMHFSAGSEGPTYAGPAEWSYRRFILHYATLAAMAGGVDAFIIGSELKGLTTARDGASSFPAVAALKTLAADARVLMGPSAKITYAADWSEYGGYQPQDGSGDVFFHLDPLWADTNIDAVGIDWYAPLSDWRAGATHLDAHLAEGVYDAGYLQRRIEGGEAYDWYYASPASRDSQARSAITDGAYGEPWVFRAKDVRNFWSRLHFDRPGGVRSATPTAWTPESKPIWFVELGCPAVDKGPNAPNLFSDAKSSESALPPYSNGARDDLAQRRLIEAYLSYWSGAANAVSPLTGKAMIEDIAVWAWDARPHPAFPALKDVWADGAAWRLGHWLNGRAGLSELSEVVSAICARANVLDADATALFGAVSGYVVDAPVTARAALEPLMAAYDFVALEREGRVVFFHESGGDPAELLTGEFAEGSVSAPYSQRADGAETPIEARVRFIDAERDYRIAAVSARRRDNAQGGVISIDAPLVLEPTAAEQIAQDVLADKRAAMETLHVELGPSHLAIEPGDEIVLQGRADRFRVARAGDAETRRLLLERTRRRLTRPRGLSEPSAPPIPRVAPTPAVAILDLPPLPDAEDDERPLGALFASPWSEPLVLYAGVPLTERCVVTAPAIMGELSWSLWPGPVDRWDDGNRFRVKLYGGELQSAATQAVLDGANVFAIESGGEWEIIQARTCTLVTPGEYEISGLLRGRLGSAHAMRAPHPVGSRIVQLDQRLGRFDIRGYEWNESLMISAPPALALPSDARATVFTAALKNVAARPWAPAQLRARRQVDGGVLVSWVRCARKGGDAWGMAEPPLGAVAESYLLEILLDQAIVRTATPGAPNYQYSVSDQIADFGVLPGSLRVRVAQIGDGGLIGLKNDLTITL